jgi:pantetheine-phosphate adenylyltransferase
MQVKSILCRSINGYFTVGRGLDLFGVATASFSFHSVGMAKAIYPGTFDPVTRGHLDVLCRATRLFDEVVVAVATNPNKGPLFSLEERLSLIEENIRGQARVSVKPFSGLVVDFAKEEGAVALIRGLRAVSDFEHEFQMAQMNRNLDESLETIFLMPGARHFYTSSSLVKQVARYGDRDTGLVPDNVRLALVRRFEGATDAAPGTSG